MALGRTGLVLLLLAGAAEGVGAQGARTDGLNLGIRISWDALTTGGPADWRLGAGARVGYGFNSTLQIFGRVHRSAWDPTDQSGGEWTMWSWDLGARIHLTELLDEWTPYLELAGTRRSGHIEPIPGPVITWPRGVISGYALTFGGGILAHLNGALAVDVGGRWGRGWVPIPTDDDPADTGVAVLGVGLSWWP